MKNITTIKLNKEFKRAYFQGKYKPHPLLVTYLVKNRLGINRVGITTSKKIGKAVERNRARRVIRAAYLQIRDQIDFPCGYDLVFVARSKTAETKSTELEKVMIKQLRFLLSQNQQKTKQKKAVYPKKDEAKWKRCWLDLSVCIKRPFHDLHRQAADFIRLVPIMPFKRFRSMVLAKDFF